MLVGSVVRRVVVPVVQDVLLNTICNGRLMPRPLRSRAWASAGHVIGRRCAINPGCHLGARTGLTLGDDSFINYGCFFDLCAPVTIGRHVQIGYQVMFCTCTHRLGPPGRRAGAPTPAPIVVEDGAWIGTRVTIMPGVRIGEGSVVAAGSVVTADCAPNTLYAGVPAQAKRSLR